MHRDPRPLGQNLCNLLVADDRRVVGSGRNRLLLLLGTIGEQAALLVAKLGGALELLCPDGIPLVRADLGQLVVELLDLGRQMSPTQPHPAAGLIDEIDGLVGQEPVGDVAVGQVGGVDQGLVGEPDPVVLLVARPQTFENTDGVGDRRLLDLDGLKTPLQRRVLLQVLAVLLERGGADGLQLTPGQHRLEDAGGVDCPFGGTGANERVDLVDEQDDVTAGADLLEHLLQALLEIAAVAGPGDQSTEVKRI